MSFNKFCLILGSGLGLTLVSLALYLMIKSENNENLDQMWNKKKKKSIITIKTSCDSVMISVPKAVVPAIIGHSGHNIKQIERKTNTSIHFDDKVFTIDSNETIAQMNERNNSSNDWVEDIDNCFGHHFNQINSKKEEFRFINIRGTQRNVRLAEDIINEIIAEEINRNICETVMFPNGCNSGLNGRTINNIQSVSGARIKVRGSRYDKNRSVSIRGSESQRSRAKDMIQTIIKSFEQ
jgi:hypothetical protein